jgi:hypothetical protein
MNSTKRRKRRWNNQESYDSRSTGNVNCPLRPGTTYLMFSLQVTVATEYSWTSTLGSLSSQLHATPQMKIYYAGTIAPSSLGLEAIDGRFNHQTFSTRSLDSVAKKLLMQGLPLHIGRIPMTPGRTTMLMWTRTDLIGDINLRLTLIFMQVTTMETSWGYHEKSQQRKSWTSDSVLTSQYPQVIKSDTRINHSTTTTQ